MAKDSLPEIPQGMQRVYRKFQSWRRTHPGVRLPIPKPLWASAARAARKHGVPVTAKVLGLEYSKLKRIAESESGAKSAAPVPRRRAHLGKARRGRSVRNGPTPKFVELVGSPASAALSECLIELEGPRGKMRIQWKGATTPDLAGLSRVLWEPA